MKIEEFMPGSKYEQKMTTKKIKKINSIIVVEKARTFATSNLFQNLFGLEFHQGTYEYEANINQNTVSIFYMDLCEMKKNTEYARQCKESSRKYDFVICLEYCNPKVEEINYNICELKKLAIDMNSVVFLFYSEQKYDKSEVLRELENFMECQYIKNLSEKVHLFNDHDRINLDCLISSLEHVWQSSSSLVHTDYSRNYKEKAKYDSKIVPIDLSKNYRPNEMPISRSGKYDGIEKCFFFSIGREYYDINY